jgi:hypothetical protein
VGIPGRRIAAWSVRDRDLFAARGGLQSFGAQGVLGCVSHDEIIVNLFYKIY